MRLGRTAGGPVVAAVAVGCWVACWRRYGLFDLPDEGLLLMQIRRTLLGETPFVDFHTGYGALYFRIEAWFLGAGGLMGVRLGTAVVHAATAGLLYALARSLVGTPLAIVAVLMHVAFFLPVSPTLGAPFNVPYPAWWAGLGGVGTSLLLMGRAHRLPVLAGAGAVAGAAFAMKPNSGLLLVAGAAIAAVLAHDGDGAPGRLARLLPWGGLIGGLALVGPTGVDTTSLALVSPLVAVGALGSRLGAPDRTAGLRLLVLGAAFAAVAAVAVGPTLLGLGAERFAREVLLLGAGVAGIYAVPMPFAAPLGALAGALLWVGWGRSGSLVLVLSMATAIVGGAWSAGASTRALLWGVEGAALSLVPVVAWGTLGRARTTLDQRLVAPAVVAALAALQLYPRADFLHLAPVAPVLLPPALALWKRAAPRLGRTVIVALPVALAALRLAPSADALVRLARGEGTSVTVGVERLHVLPEGRGRLEALGDTVAALRAATGAEERVLAFPACAVATFFAERRAAGPHDYFYPGRPDRRAVISLVGRLAADPPAAVVTCRPGGPIEAAWSHHPEMVRFLADGYSTVLDRSPFVLGRRAP